MAAAFQTQSGLVGVRPVKLFSDEIGRWLGVFFQQEHSPC